MQPLLFACMYGFSCMLNHIHIVQGHMHGTAGGGVRRAPFTCVCCMFSCHWTTEAHLLLHSPLSLSLFFLYPCCPSVPTVFLPPLCPPFLLSFISPPSHVHSWPTVRVLLLLSCCILVIPSSQLCLFGMNLRWHWFNLLKCKGSWEPAGPK